MNLQLQRFSWVKILVFLLVAAGGGHWANAQTTVLFEGFEVPGFTNRWRVDDQFVSEEPVTWGVVNSTFGGEGTRNGTNKIYCSASSYLGSASAPAYKDNMSTYFEREFNLTNMTSSTLSFWYKAKIYYNEAEGWSELWLDTLTVSVDGIPLWDSSQLELPATGWTPVSINLNDWGIAGGVHTLRFEFNSDGGGQEDFSSQGEGVYVDDILVTGYTGYQPDYNKDGVADLVWWRTNGYAVTWLLTNAPGYSTNLPGPEYKSTYYLRGGYQVTEPNWEILGQSDFNLDSRSDLLLKHKDGRLAVWYMNGPALLSSAAVNYRATANLQFLALTDFNSDKHRDFLWMNTTNRSLAVWVMKNNVYQWTTYLLKSDKVSKFTVLSGYTPVLMYDFNLDGSKDLLTQKASDGWLGITYFSGAVNIATKAGESFTFSSSSGIKSTTGWKVMGGTDFNNDGHLDLLVQHTDGRIAIWFMERNVVTGQRILKQKTPAGWKLAGPR